MVHVALALSLCAAAPVLPAADVADVPPPADALLAADEPFTLPWVTASGAGLAIVSAAAMIGSLGLAAYHDGRVQDPALPTDERVQAQVDGRGAIVAAVLTAGTMALGVAVAAVGFVRGE